MTFYTNSTTERLEGFARARGLDYGIVVSPNNSSGRLFIVRDGNEVLHRWRSLGWSTAEARETIVQGAEHDAHNATAYQAAIQEWAVEAGARG